MKMTRGLEEHQNIEQGIDALYEKFGPAETRRFIALMHPHDREDSVIRHRKWQASLNKEEFLTRMRAAYSKARKKAVR